MTATRTWRYPDLRNGTTIHHISDTHFGTVYLNTFVQAALNRAQADIEDLRVANNGGHLHTGDMINWFADTPNGPSGTDAVRVTEETAYKAFRDAIKTADGLAWAEVCGNHDLLGAKDASGQRPGRTSIDWAQAMGLASPNNAYDFKDFRVLTVSPDTWVSDQNGTVLRPYILSSATLDWLDSQLSADARPTFVAAHVTLTEQYGDDGTVSVTSANNPRIYDFIASHTNLIGWLSGHRHNGIGNNTWAEVLTVNGRKLFLVCGPGGGSGKSAAGNAYQHGQFGSYVYSSYMTLLDENTLDIRFRDHLAKTWASGATATETHRLLSRA